MSYVMAVLIAWPITVIGIIAFMWFKDRGKEKVEIYNVGSLESSKKYSKTKGQIILRKGSKGRGPKGWIVPIKDSYVYYKTWFGLKLARKLMIVQGNDDFIKFMKGKEAELSRFQVDKLFEANVLKNAGHTLQSLKVPFMLYMVLGFILVMGIMQLLVMSGRLRI